MKIVRENINFERGVSPRETLGVGEEWKIDPYRLSEIDWERIEPWEYKIKKDIQDRFDLPSEEIYLLGKDDENTPEYMDNLSTILNKKKSFYSISLGDRESHHIEWADDLELGKIYLKRFQDTDDIGGRYDLYDPVYFGTREAITKLKPWEHKLKN